MLGYNECLVKIIEEKKFDHKNHPFRTFQSNYINRIKIQIKSSKG